MAILKFYAKAVINEFTFSLTEMHGWLLSFSNRPNILVKNSVVKSELMSFVDLIANDNGATRLDRVLIKVFELLNSQLNSQNKISSTVVILAKGNSNESTFFSVIFF